MSRLAEIGSTLRGMRAPGAAKLAESKDHQEAEKTMAAVSEAATPYPHIDTSAGVPVIAGSTMKVVELVMAQRAHGWSPEELHFQFPHLSMAQIHAALGYYWDHRSELDADIDRRKQVVDELRPTSRTRLWYRSSVACGRRREPLHRRARPAGVRMEPSKVANRWRRATTS